LLAAKGARVAKNARLLMQSGMGPPRRQEAKGAKNIIG
jgi:hypothetical protein